MTVDLEGMVILVGNIFVDLELLRGVWNLVFRFEARGTAFCKFPALRDVAFSSL